MSGSIRFLHRSCLIVSLVASVVLGLIPFPLHAADNTLTPEQKADGWIALFDGKTLDGWTVKSGFATYSVEDGAVLGTTALKSPNTFLCTVKKYGDFDLTMDVKLDDRGLNSGVQVRSGLKAGGPYGGRVYGPQVEIAPNHSGYIFGEATGRRWLTEERPAHTHFKINEWVTFRIRAVGNRIETWIADNKITALTLDDELFATHAEGYIGLQVHGVGDRGPFTVRWKNIYLKPLREEK